MFDSAKMYNAHDAIEHKIDNILWKNQGIAFGDKYAIHNSQNFD